MLVKDLTDVSHETYPTRNSTDVSCETTIMKKTKPVSCETITIKNFHSWTDMVSRETQFKNKTF